MKKEYILVTGAAGFIGFHLINKLIEHGAYVIGIDNMNNYYSVKLKKKRIRLLKKSKKFVFIKNDLNNLQKIKIDFKIMSIFHLAASAGVRDSINHPTKFIDENIKNTIKVYEFAKKKGIKKIYYASSSSVYGDNNIFPSNEELQLNKPLSVYGITKIATENIASYYSKIFNISSVGFRFFTVYGPLGRPDMSIYLFMNAIKFKKTLILNNRGKNYRDYTHVNEIIFYLYHVYLKTKNKRKFNIIFNIGGQKNYKLTYVVKVIEKLLNRKTKISLKPKLSVDPIKSLASNKKIKKFVNKKFKSISLEEGLRDLILNDR